MDSRRVKEILASDDSIEVNYNGSPVWIESLEGELAKVRSLNSPEHFVVTVKELIEG